MNEPQSPECNTALAGALERAENLPDYNGPQLQPTDESWDDGNVWFDDWGKWEKYD